jgi:hypothetical protein
VTFNEQFSFPARIDQLFQSFQNALCFLALKWMSVSGFDIPADENAEKRDVIPILRSLIFIRQIFWLFRSTE